MISSVKHSMLALIVVLGSPMLAHGQQGPQAVQMFHLSQQHPASVASFAPNVRLSFSPAARQQAGALTSEKQLKSDEQSQGRSPGDPDRFTPLLEHSLRQRVSSALGSNCGRASSVRFFGNKHPKRKRDAWPDAVKRDAT